MKRRNFMKQLIFLVWVFAATLIVSIPAFAAPVWSTFDANADGWTIACANGQAVESACVGGSTPTYEPTGGPSNDGHISYTDLDPQTDFFDAPAKFLGNQSNAAGGTLTFDLLNSIGKANSPFMVVLKGGGATVRYDGTQAVTTNWANFTVPLDFTSPTWRTLVGSSWSVTTDNAILSSVVANLTDLWIRGDWASGKDVTRLDNVHLNAVPIPGAALLFGTGIIGLIGIARRSLFIR